MTTTEQRLADALRAVIDTAPGGVRANEADNIAAKRDGILALAAYDAFMLGVAEAHSDVTTHVGPDLIETYDAGRASVRGVED